MGKKAKTWVSEKTRSQSMAWGGGGNRHQNERVTLGTHGQDLLSSFLVSLCVTGLEISIYISELRACLTGQPSSSIIYSFPKAAFSSKENSVPGERTPGSQAPDLTIKAVLCHCFGSFF